MRDCGCCGLLRSCEMNGLKKQLQGLAWILFGMLLVQIVHGIAQMGAQMVWGAALFCGLLGLVMVICSSGPED